MSSSFIEPVLAGMVFIAQDVKRSSSSEYHYFTTSDSFRYSALCDDFGPMNMGSVIKFVQLLDSQLDTHPTGKIVHLVDSGRRALTNAVFLMGAYLILRRDYTMRRVSDIFNWANNKVEAFRDATYETSDFGLTLLDCWQGLERGKQMGWIAVPTIGSKLWGKIDPKEFEWYDDPLNADLHEVIPGKFVAFQGPKSMGKQDHHDDKRGYRSFSADHFAQIFKFLEITKVVRLNEAEYDARIFKDQGIEHVDLAFPDCTAPPPAVVEAFLRAADNTPGKVAVHCKAGLGRTGTLIALYMMRSYGFSARAAIGWLRIMRPGSVIGEQQHYLCLVQEYIARSLASVDNYVLAPIATSTALCGGGAKSEHIAAQVAKGMERRGAARNLCSVAPVAVAAVSAGANNPRSWLPAIRSALSRSTPVIIQRVR